MSKARTVLPAMRAKSTAQRIADLAAKQWGVISRWQLLDAGLSSSAIDRWVQAGRLYRVHRGVYALGHARLTVMGRVMAALLWAGPGAALSHTTAAWWWGIIAAEPKVIHLSVPGKVRATKGVKVHRPRRVDATTHKGLPVTTIARTISDISSMLQFRELRKAIAEADFKRLIEPGELRATGKPALRRALNRHQPLLAKTKSDLEVAFTELCEDYDIDMPELNVWRAGHLVDAVWESRKLVVELDGGAAHGTPARMEEDRRRELDLRKAGHRVVRYSWRQIFYEPGAVAEDLTAQLS